MNRFLNLPLEIQRRIINFCIEKELAEKLNIRLKNNIMDYKSRKKKLYYEIIRPHLKFKVNRKERNRERDLLISELENGNTKMFWELTILSIEYNILSKNSILGLKYYNNNELKK